MLDKESHTMLVYNYEKASKQKSKTGEEPFGAEDGDTFRVPPPQA